MARGYFRNDRFVCLFCGKRSLTIARGAKNNPMFLCLKCSEIYDESVPSGCPDNSEKAGASLRGRDSKHEATE